MTEGVQISIIVTLGAAVPICVGQYLTYRGQKLALIAQNKELLEKLNEQSEKLGEIHVQTNSNFDAQKREIKAYKDQVELLIKEKGEAKGEADAKSKQ